MEQSLTISRLDEIDAAFAGCRSWIHPNMLGFIKSKVGNKCYFDLEEMVEKFNDLLLKLKMIDQSGKKILFVATYTKIKRIIGKFISQTNHFYVDNRWLGGTLTNFDLIQKRLFLLQDFYNQERKDWNENLTKKEKLKFQIKKSNLETNLKGILEMTTTPDYLFVVGPRAEEIAIKEAQKLKIPIIAMTKGDSDPKQFLDFLPINDVSSEVLKLIMKRVVDFALEKKTTLLIHNE